MEHRAFICHSNLDFSIASKLVTELEKAGIPCWIAPRNIPSGSTYAASIVQGIKTSTLFIFVFTKSSNNSDAVINEIEKANSLNITIIPFKLEKEEYSDSLEYYLRRKQSVIAYGKSMENAIDELIVSIGAKSIHNVKDQPEPPKKIKWFVLVTIFFIFLVITIIYFVNSGKPTTDNPVDTSEQVKHGDGATSDTLKKGIEIITSNSLTLDDIIEPDDIPSITGVGPNGFFFVRKARDGHIEYSNGQLGGGGSPWKAINKDDVVNGSAPSASSLGNNIYLVITDNNKALQLCQGTFNGGFGQWISMNFISNAKPAITTVGSTLYFFAKSDDDQIFYNNAPLNSIQTSWNKVDGNIKAASAPSAGSVNNHLFVAVRGSDDKIYYNQADLGGVFNQNWNVIDFKTKVAPTLVGCGNYIYIFAVNTEGEIWFTRAQLTKSFEDWKIVEGNGRTKFSITAGTAGLANYIFLEMKGLDGNIYLNQGFDRFQDSWAFVK